MIRSGNGWEYCSKAFDTLYKMQGIPMYKNTPYSP
jgi:hypothetical protein